VDAARRMVASRAELQTSQKGHPSLLKNHNSLVTAPKIENFVPLSF